MFVTGFVSTTTRLTRLRNHSAIISLRIVSECATDVGKISAQVEERKLGFRGVYAYFRLQLKTRVEWAN